MIWTLVPKSLHVWKKMRLEWGCGLEQAPLSQLISTKILYLVGHFLCPLTTYHYPFWNRTMERLWSNCILHSSQYFPFHDELFLVSFFKKRSLLKGNKSDFWHKSFKLVVFIKMVKLCLNCANGNTGVTKMQAIWNASCNLVQIRSSL